MDLAPRISNIDKNYLMNGAMDLFQRFISPSAFSGVSLSTSWTFPTADRWAQRYTGTWGTGTPASCSSTTVPNSNSKYSLNIIGGPSVITDEAQARQRIESHIVSELTGQTVSLGLMVQSSSASHITLELWLPSVTDNYTSSSLLYTSTKVIPLNSWQAVTFEGITLPNVTKGLEARIRLSNHTVLGTTTYIYLTQIGLTKTPTFESFNRFGGSFISELRACLRYFEKSYELETNPGTITNNGNWYQPSGGLTFLTIPFKEYKRSPSVLLTPYSPDTGSSGVVGSGGGDSSQPAFTCPQGNFFLELNASFPVRTQWTADSEI